MSDTKDKPDIFRAGQTLSAKALNLLRDAIPRLFRGGSGVAVTKVGDRYIISLSDTQGTRPGSIHIVEVVSVFPEYLKAKKLGEGGQHSIISVAKPWGMRKGTAWPAGPTYTYNEAGTSRTAVSGSITETQVVTPNYQIGEQLLAVRLPSARIKDVDDNLIFWEDINQAGRCWAAV